MNFNINFNSIVVKNFLQIFKLLQFALDIKSWLVENISISAHYIIRFKISGASKQVNWSFPSPFPTFVFCTSEKLITVKWPSRPLNKDLRNLNKVCLITSSFWYSLRENCALDRTVANRIIFSNEVLGFSRY